MIKTIIVLVLIAAFAVITALMTAGKRADEQVRRAYLNAHNPVPCDTDELVNRINRHSIKRVAKDDYPDRVRVYRKAINHKGRLVKVMVTDGREAWMHKMGVYGEQVDIMVTEMKSILSANGVS